MKRLLFLVDSAGSLENWDRVGSLARIVRYFNTLTDNSFEIHIISPDVRDYTFRLKKDGCHHSLPIRSRFGRLVSYSLLSPFLFRQVFRQCDLYRARFSSVLPAIIAKKIYKKPIVSYFDWNWVGFSKQYNENICEYSVKSMIEKLMIKHSDYFITTTDTLKAYLLEKGFYSEKRIFILPNYVDTQLFKPTATMAKSGQVEILGVGRLHEQKNFALLIDAASIVKTRKGRDVKLTIVGSGYLKTTLSNLARENGMDLEIIDRIPNEKMPSVYNKHHLFVMTSTKEGHPRALLEAMSCGLPVIGTDVEGVRDIIDHGENGLLCSEDEEDVADKISYLISDTEAAIRLGKHARRYVAENYSFPNLIQKEAAIYGLILSDPRHRRNT